MEHLVGLLDTFAHEVPEARMTTMVAVRLEPDGQVELVSAGHLPALIRRSDGTVEQLPDADAPLGLVAAITRRVHRRQLGPGDVLLLYTDGLVERRGENIDLGLQRLRSALVNANLAPGADLAAELHRQLGSPRGDDVAVLAIRRTV